MTTEAPVEPAVELPRVTFTLHALIEDFPFDVQFAGSADQLKATVARLRALGAVPPTPAARAAVAAEKAREAPRCEFHGPMKESTKAPRHLVLHQEDGRRQLLQKQGMMFARKHPRPADHRRGVLLLSPSSANDYGCFRRFIDRVGFDRLVRGRVVLGSKAARSTSRA